MSEQNTPDGQGPNGSGNGPGGGGPNPWIRSLMIWGGIFLALLLAVSMFGGTGESAGTQISYSDFRERVSSGTVEEVQIADDRITGTLKNGETFSTVPVKNDTSLTKLLEENGVTYSGTPTEQMNILWVILIQSLPFLLILGIAFFAVRQVQKNGGAGGAMGFGKSKAKMLTEKQGRVTFADVAGIDHREPLGADRHRVDAVAGHYVLDHHFIVDEIGRAQDGRVHSHRLDHPLDAELAGKMRHVHIEVAVDHREIDDALDPGLAGKVKRNQRLRVFVGNNPVQQKEGRDTGKSAPQ